MLKVLNQLPRTVWIIGLISLINDASSDMLYPLIPLYLTSVLMAGPKALGLIEGVADATASLLKLFSGMMMDRTRRAKPWMIVGYSLAGIGRPLIAIITSWPSLLLIRFADRIGKGLRSSPRDALLASSVAPEHRGLAFGVHRAMDNAGAVIGPLFAAWLLASQVPLQNIFLWSIVPAFIGVLLACTLRETAIVPISQPLRWQLQDMPAAFKRYLLVIALFTLGNSSNMFLLLRAHELGMPQAQIPLLWAGLSAVAMLLAAPLASLSDLIGRKRVLLAGYVAFACVYVGLGLLAHSGWLMLLMFALYGIFMAATEGVEKALVADLAPEGKSGTAFGWFNLTAGIFLLPSSVLFGWLYEAFSPLTAFGFAGTCALSAALMLLKLVKLPDQTEPSTL